MIRKFSGYRIRFLPAEKQAHAMAELRNLVRGIEPAIRAAVKEPYFLDDHLRHLDPLDLLMYGLQEGELFLCMADQYVGLVFLREITHERSAVIEAVAHPDYRQGLAGRRLIKKFALEVIEYAFSPWPNGLGLKKLKADIALDNRPAGRAAVNLGFVQVGISPLDAFFEGRPVDKVMLELLNPAYFNLAAPVILHEIESPDASADQPELPEPATVPGPAESSDGSAAGILSAEGDQAGEQSGGSTTDLLADSGELQHAGGEARI